MFLRMRTTFMIDPQHRKEELNVSKRRRFFAGIKDGRTLATKSFYFWLHLVRTSLQARKQQPFFIFFFLFTGIFLRLFFVVCSLARANPSIMNPESKKSQSSQQEDVSNDETANQGNIPESKQEGSATIFRPKMFPKMETTGLFFVLF